MAYWVAVCQSDTNPGIQPGGTGVGTVLCRNADGTTAMQSLEAQLMIVPPAGSGFDGFWQLGAISVSDAVVLSAAICGAWAVAWGARVLRLAIADREPPPEE